MLDKFAINKIHEFWGWINERKEDVGVQYLDENNFWLYMAFDHDMLNEFTDRYQYHCEEGGCQCLMQMNSLCFNVVDLEGGYGFTMKELWDNRPEGIEDILGANIY